MSAVHVRKSMIISRPPEEVYGMYRELRNHSRLSPHLQSVEVLDYKRSHWISQTPGGKTVEWTAEITADEPNGHLAWKTVPGSDIDSAGDVWFVRAPGPLQPNNAVKATVTLAKPISNGLNYNFTFTFEKAGQASVTVPISAGLGNQPA